jgi:hypothetical protein
MHRLRYEGARCRARALIITTKEEEILRPSHARNLDWRALQAAAAPWRYPS